MSKKLVQTSVDLSRLLLVADLRDLPHSEAVLVVRQLMLDMMDWQEQSLQEDFYMAVHGAIEDLIANPGVKT